MDIMCSVGKRAEIDFYCYARVLGKSLCLILNSLAKWVSFFGLFFTGNLSRFSVVLPKIMRNRRWAESDSIDNVERCNVTLLQL